MPIFFEFSYDFTKEEHKQDDVKIDLGDLHLAWNLKAQQTVGYIFSRKPLGLDYTPVKSDMLGDPSVTADKDYKSVTPNYATFHGTIGGRLADGWMLHGNNRIRVNVDGKDVTRSFDTVRYMRGWTAPIDGNGSRHG